MRIGELFTWLVGRRGRGVAHPLSAGRAWSRSKTERDPVKFEPQLPAHPVVLLDDVDPATHKVRPTYLEDRAARRSVEEDEEMLVGTVSYDVSDNNDDYF
jgi:hypothetical protein